MNPNSHRIMPLRVVYVIVDEGKSRPVLKIAKQHGARGGTVIPAKGVASDRLSRFLSLDEEDKELIIIVSTDEIAKEIVEVLFEKLKLHKPNHGIIFTRTINQFAGNTTCINPMDREREEERMYDLVTTIVDMGYANDVVEIANQNGATGGTILHGRGAGSERAIRVFNMDIDPEKEVILMITKRESTEDIVDAIYKHMNLGEAGAGIIYVQALDSVKGLTR